jgi:hypothetical protein
LATKGHYHEATSSTGRQYDVRALGRIVPSDDGFDVARVSDGGVLRIVERDRARRKPTFEALGEGGQVVRRLDGRPATSSEARTWMARVLPLVWRETGMAAEPRVESIFGRHGFEGVIEEMSRLSGCHASRLYAEALLARHRLPTAALVRLAAQAGRDAARGPEDAAAILTAVARQGLPDEALHDAFADAVRRVPSPAQQGKALHAWIETGDLSNHALLILLRTIAGVGSDQGRAGLLVTLAGRQAIGGAARDEFRRTASALRSATYRDRALAALAEAPTR